MRRIVGWVVFVAFLVAVGAFVHAVAEPVPTWVASAPADTHPVFERIVAGRAFLTARKVEVWWGGPVTARDGRTGEVLYAADNAGHDLHPLQSPAASADARRVLVTLSGDRILLWLDAAEVHRLTFNTAVQTALSPDGEWLLVEERDDRRPLDEPSRLRVLRWGGERRTLGAARMGSLRWSPDGAFFTFHDGGGVVLYDPARRRGLARIPARAIYGLSPDGKALWASRGDGCELWNLDDPSHPRRTAIVPGEGHAFPEFGPDGGLWFLPQAETEEAAKKARLHVWDPGRGAKRWEVPLTERGFWHATFSPCGRYAALRPTSQRAGWGDRVPMALFDTRTGAERWRAPKTEDILFSPDGDALIDGPEPGGGVPPGRGIQLYRTEVESPGSASGVPRQLADWQLFMPITSPRFTPGRLWVIGIPHRVGAVHLPWWLHWVQSLRPTPREDLGILLALDWTSGRTAFRLAQPWLSEYVTANDGSYVITFQTFSDHTRLCRWDVPARKPWLRIVGVPLFIGLVLLGLRVLWARYRAATADPNRSREPAT
jgi:hypothetical protein